MRVRYTGPTAAKYIQYYQKGESLPHFRGDIYGQRGAGVGSIFAKLLGGIRGLISSTPEWIKTGVKEVAKQAAKTGRKRYKKTSHHSKIKTTQQCKKTTTS